MQDNKDCGVKIPSSDNYSSCETYELYRTFKGWKCVTTQYIF